MKLILGNHWTAAPEGWTVLRQEDQDLTAPLKWKDGEVSVIFTEHVLEHITLTDGILFFKEAFRVLKTGGIIRTVCPLTDKIAYSITQTGDKQLYQNYYRNSLEPHYYHDISALREIGVDASDHWHPFMVDSLIKNHGHKFVWSSDLMVHVLERIGFRQVSEPAVGYSFHDNSNCLERRFRGVDSALAEESGYRVFDPEGKVVEARK